MSASADDKRSIESSPKEDTSSGGAKRQKGLEDQLGRAKKEVLEILRDSQYDPETLSAYAKSAGTKSKRIPYLYSINDNQTLLVILQGDITRTKVDAIVNAANEHMTGGGGVDGIIHDAAGPQLYDACKAHKQIKSGVRLPTGHSRILLSYDMLQTTYYIINTAGPRYSRYKAKECAQELTSCYKTALALAALYDLESIGFTAISCGIFGYPVDEGADVALRTVSEKADTVPVVVFVLWDNHIYDAWIRKAKELNFTLVDPKDLLIEKPSTASTASTEEETTVSAPDVQSERPQLSANATRTTDETAVENSEDLLRRLPSVPNDSSNTQDMDSADAEQDDKKPPLTTQNTAEMAEPEREKENSTANSEGSSSHPEGAAPKDVSKPENHPNPN